MKNERGREIIVFGLKTKRSLIKTCTFIQTQSRLKHTI